MRGEVLVFGLLAVIFGPPLYFVLPGVYNAGLPGQMKLAFKKMMDNAKEDLEAEKRSALAGQGNNVNDAKRKVAEAVARSRGEASALPLTSEENLAFGEKWLVENAKKDGVVCVENGNDAARGLLIQCKGSACLQRRPETQEAGRRQLRPATNPLS